MSNGMIERVARAIAKSEVDDDRAYEEFLHEAYAAIEAMREPTEAMINAGQWQVDPVSLYQSFIDAALSEVEG